ncbi:MAG TPA: cytochrome c oxidase subunit I [Acidimicrobiales bacterium]|nr:cytochrome c oxidase subunit I [Acidimicrobiales bacterium]
MAVLERQRAAGPPPPEQPEPTGLLNWLTTTDHKLIGLSYLWTSFGFFLLAGVLAMLMRAELAQPGLQVVSRGEYNQLFTMHGTMMMFLFAAPFGFGLANYLVPLHVGAPDMAFPRLNALSYWLYLGGGLTVTAGFVTAGGAAAFGWTGYAPLSSAIHSPGAGVDLWIAGLLLTGVSTIATAVNIIATAFCLRAPGMTMFRMPIFTWNMVVTSMLVLLAFPVFTAALVMLFADRHLGTHIFEEAGGGQPILWQHLFWFFGHPEVYIIVLPFFGVVTEILPVFSRKPVFGYKGIVFATLAIAGLSVGVWAHHMFATGAVLLPFFSGMSFLIAVPTGVKFFNWIGTMWRGQLSFEPPMLFAVGFLVVFLLGGLSGVLLASAPVDFDVTDTYFVVAHMHYVLFGSAVFAGFGAVYFWFPKWTGRMMRTRPAWLHFVLLFAGFNLTFFPQHLLGLRGMVRRVADYGPHDGFTFLNMLSSAGAGLIALSVLPFAWNLLVSIRKGAPAGDNPWDGHTLEWATSSPPPEHNFTSLPPIRSNRPVFDANHGADAG